MTRNKKVKQAVILAAGEREEFDRPVGFLPVEDMLIIERLINMLKENGIEKIFIITGYESQYFDELAANGIELIYSDRYKWTGTMHSLSLADGYVDGDFLLIEGDLVFEEIAIEYLMESKHDNCMVLVNESGSGDEVLAETRDQTVFRISKDMHQLSRIGGEFVGISRISLEAYREMLLDFKYSENPYLHYEYVMMNIRDKHNTSFVKIDNLVWGEVDSQKSYNNLKYYIYPKIKQKKLAYTEQYIIQLLKEVMGDEYQVVGPIERLGGMNNNNYRLNTNINDLVFRLPGKGSNESVDRKSEMVNSQLTYDIGLNAKTVYFDKESGLKITEYIEDAETLNITTAKRENNMERMAYALNLLHDSDIELYKDFHPFKEILDYKETITREDKMLLDSFEDLDLVVNFLKEEIAKTEIDYVPCHLDAWPENFVKSGDKIYLIDWEYSSNYDRLWDVVSIALECDYTRNEEELFLNKYFGRSPKEEELAKMEVLRVLMDIYWAMWALAKVSSGEGELFEYSLGRFNRGVANLNKLESYKNQKI